MKRLIGIILSIIIVISCTTPISVEAKVIDPEVVKTESWTTSYYIDDMDTLYPYIQCEADIYNDGTIKLYMWNTHEWDGFATVRHKITVTQSYPVSTQAVPYSIVSGKTINYSYEFWSDGKWIERDVARLISNDLKNVDLSYYDGLYNISTYSGSFGTLYERYNYAIYDERFNGSYPNIGNNLSFLAYTSALPNMKAFSNRPEIYDCIKYIVFKPLEDPTGTYNFRLFGHDITITQELLSGSVVAEPELTEQEKYIKQLEEENARLKASITNTNLFGDINGDNLVDVADAQMILNYYVYTLVNSNAEPLEEWISKQ